MNSGMKRERHEEVSYIMHILSYIKILSYISYLVVFISSSDRNWSILNRQ